MPVTPTAISIFPAARPTPMIFSSSTGPTHNICSSTPRLPAPAQMFPSPLVWRAWSWQDVSCDGGSMIEKLIGNPEAFPILREWDFFNHAGVSPLPRVAADALRKYAQQAETVAYIDT